MDLALALYSGTGPTGGALDIHAGLEDLVAQFTMLGAATVREFNADHPTLPTAGRHISLGSQSLHVVLMDPRSGRGKPFIATLTKQDAAATAAEVEAFRDMIASIDFDPTRACMPGPNRTTIPTRLPGPGPAKPAQKAPEPEANFNLRRAATGCETLSLAFVPTYCHMVTIEGNDALFVFIDDNDGTESAATYLQRFREPIARPFCHEAERHPKGAPILVFHAENSGVAHQYDCQSRTLGRVVPLPEGM